MTIRIYPSLMDGAPLEVHEWEGSIGAWLESHDIDYADLDPQPIAITVNGRDVCASLWGETQVSATDNVEIRLLPHGGVFKAVGRVFNLLFGWLLPSHKSRNYNDPGQGQRLDAASAKANQAKMGDVVPELAGRHIRYPDYLTPPRRWFESPREQWAEFLACVGPGKYLVNSDEVRIGDTQIDALGSDARYALFAPGQNVSVDSAHEHWHTVDEVGSTSSGTPGLELSIETESQEMVPASTYSFSGSTVSMGGTAGHFPSAWGAGTQVEILLRLNYEVTKINGPQFSEINVFSGNFQHLKPLSNGDRIHASVAGGGEYIVQALNVDSQGDGSLQLWTVPKPETEFDPPVPSEPLGSLSPSTRTITFDNGPYTLASAEGRQITVSGRSFGAPAMPSSRVTINYKSGVLYGEWTSLIAACPMSETTSTIELDFFFPSGLNEIKDSGDVINRTVQTEIQYRDVGSSTFTSISKSYTNNTLNQIGYTWQIAVPNIRPEVRVRRVATIETSTQVNDTIQWFGLKSRLKTKTSYPNWTTIAIRMRSGGKLASNAENKLNLVATRILPKLQGNGTWGPEAPTRNIADFVKYIASTIGYTDENINMVDFTALSNIWNGRDEYLDYIYDETTVKAAIDLAFAAGMSELTVEGGKIRPVRDDLRTTWEQGYSPQNMIGPLRRTFAPRKHDDPDGVEVEYTDANSWVKSVVQCRLPGDQGLKVAKIKVDGVTSGVRAWRIGMRHLRALRYRPWQYGFTTELEGLNSSYLSFVPLVGSDPDYGQSAIMTSIKTQSGQALITVNELLDWQDGKDHVIAYRRKDGSVAGPYWASQGASEYQVLASIPTPWPAINSKMEPPHVYFGTAEDWCFPALITNINPNNTEVVKISAVNYDARVYADDNNSPQD